MRRRLEPGKRDDQVLPGCHTPILSDFGFLSGGERTRTADFHVANVALYQLSYTPETE